MKTYRISTLMRLFGLAFLAVALSAGLASAEDYEGTFTLPVETHWGVAVLPSGDYSFKFETDSGGKATVWIRHGNDNVAIIRATGGISQRDVDHSALIGVRASDRLYIRALHLADGNLSLQYAMPKDAGKFIADAGPKLIQRVPVLMAAK